MRLDEPSWWYGGADDIRQRALIPFGRLYGWIAEHRYRRRHPYRSRLPVICVGNFTAGGTGKTPLSLFI
ncbi:MAG: tetraacyldisaccharide 4'-kinase, partial [Hyphomicrobium sp.]